MESDLLYYRRRHAEEAAAAAYAKGPKVAAAHSELARYYHARVKQLEAAPAEFVSAA